MESIVKLIEKKVQFSQGSMDIDGNNESEEKSNKKDNYNCNSSSSSKWRPFCENQMGIAYDVINNFYNSLEVSSSHKSFISTASASWLETILTEICLRNRDRFQLCWEILKHHYLKTFGSRGCPLSYITER